jgi:hypothetical protein
VARAISGEYRVWLTDVYRRSISSEFFSGTITPRDPKTGTLDTANSAALEMSLDKDYCLATLDRRVKSVQVFIKYPGNSVKNEHRLRQPQRAQIAQGLVRHPVQT